MRARTKIIFQSKHYELVKRARLKSDRTYYTIRITASHIRDGIRKVSTDDYRSHFDPAGNRGAKHGLSWKFGNRKDAEQLIMTAIIKWGE